MKKLKLIALILILLFACIGLLFTSVFIGMQFGWLNVRGSIETRNNSIISVGDSSTSTQSAQSADSIAAAADYSCTDGSASCPWNDTREWTVVSGGLTKDLTTIAKVSNQTGVPPRLIATVVVPEQIRFFTSNREVFKRYFEPLKILGSLSKFSLGVSGMKQDTANATEQYALDPQSPFYPGDAYASLFAYQSGEDHDATLYDRLTNDSDHYYSYLYTALFIKEILAQWERAGYDISDQPQIVATLFNLGFANSQPKADPQVGGAIVTVGGSNYTFGELGGLFYQSDQLPAFQ